MESYDIPTPPPAISPDCRDADYCSTPPKKRTRPRRSGDSEDPLNWMAGQLRIFWNHLDALNSRLDHIEASIAASNSTADIEDRYGHIVRRLFLLETRFNEDHGLLDTVAEGSAADFSYLKTAVSDLTLQCEGIASLEELTGQCEACERGVSSLGELVTNVEKELHGMIVDDGARRESKFEKCYDRRLDELTG